MLWTFLKLIAIGFVTLSLPPPGSNPDQHKDVGHTSIVTCVALSPDGKAVLSGSKDESIKLWNVVTGEILWTAESHKRGVNAVTFSPDGKTALSGGNDGKLRLWDVETGKQIGIMRGHGRDYDEYGNGVLAVAFSPDGKTALSGSMDFTAKLWDVKERKNILTFRGHQGPVKSVGFSPDGMVALSSGADGLLGGTIRLWDISTGKEIRRIVDEDFIKYAAFLPEGKKILSGQATTLKLWDATTGEQLLTFDQKTFIDSVALLPDGTTALAGSRDGDIRIWNLITGEITGVLKGHSKTVYSLAFDRDGRKALSGSADQTIKLWEIDSGKVLRNFPKNPSDSYPVASFEPRRSCVQPSCRKAWIDRGRQLRKMRVI
jgi:WD40 repeat protein